MAAVGNGVGKSTDGEMDNVHAKEKTVSADLKARIEAKNPNCKSYMILIVRIGAIIIVYPNSYSWICINFFFSQDLMTVNMRMILSLRL